MPQLNEDNKLKTRAGVTGSLLTGSLNPGCLVTGKTTAGGTTAGMNPGMANKMKVKKNQLQLMMVPKLKQLLDLKKGTLALTLLPSGR